MGKSISALLVGLIFGLGLAVAEMVNPAKVLGFLDLFGNWDPSLAFVMGGALVVTAIGYRIVWKRPKPVFEARFQVPGNRTIDKRLMIGAILFGVGWGLVGLCPGPALASLTFGGLPAIGFAIAMLVGVSLYEAYDRMHSKTKTA